MGCKGVYNTRACCHDARLDSPLLQPDTLNRNPMTIFKGKVRTRTNSDATGDFAVHSGTNSDLTYPDLCILDHHHHKIDQVKSRKFILSRYFYKHNNTRSYELFYTD